MKQPASSRNRNLLDLGMLMDGLRMREEGKLDDPCIFSLSWEPLGAPPHQNPFSTL